MGKGSLRIGLLASGKGRMRKYILSRFVAEFVLVLGLTSGIWIWILDSGFGFPASGDWCLGLGPWFDGEREGFYVCVFMDGGKIYMRLIWDERELRRGRR